MSNSKGADYIQKVTSKKKSKKFKLSLVKNRSKYY